MIIRRCETCSTEGRPPKMFDMTKDEWYHLYKSEDDTLDFCTVKCIQDYFVARSMIQDIE